MTLHKKDGMWISDWNVSDGANDEGCYKRQKEQDRKARAIVAKLKTQGWKRIPEKKVNNTLMFIIGSAELLTALKKYNADVKKKWANKKVSTSIPGRRVGNIIVSSPMVMLKVNSKNGSVMIITHLTHIL